LLLIAIKQMTSNNYALILYILASYFIVASGKEQKDYKRIAIIGGGISGTFAAKYLSDYDDKCLLDITLFSAPPPVPSNDEIEQETDQNYHQGSRVSSATLQDGTVVELGASIIFEGNKLVNEMIEGDPNLIKVEPYSVGREISKGEKLKMKTGMGIYNGKEKKNQSPWSLLVANMTSSQVEKTMLWRYNLDLWRVDRATKRSLESFNLIYDILESNHEKSFLDSPNDVWKAVGLSYAASISFDQYLDSIGVSSSVSWWKGLLLGSQGVARAELYTAINICNNNQLNSQMTGR
jgi:prenylcysteine oxidase/farnesylcysteine lyase